MSATIDDITISFTEVYDEKYHKEGVKAETFTPFSGSVQEILFFFFQLVKFAILLFFRERIVFRTDVGRFQIRVD